MKRLLITSLSALTLFVASCATTTPYQQASSPGAFDGYSQTMIENNRARVTFGGNSLTDRETVENYLLYRAAELTVEKGFDYFQLQERDTETNTRVQVSPRFYGAYDPFFSYSFFRPSYGWSPYGRYSLFYGNRYRRGFYGGSRFGFGFGYDPFFNDYDVRELTKYRATAEVIFGRGSKPSGLNAFNAREVLSNLGPSIIFPEEEA